MYAGPINNETDAAYFQAVGEFQRSQNIAQDGLVGPDTLKKLQAAWPEIFDPTTGSASSPKAPSTQPDTVALLQTAPADQTPQPGLSPSERYGIHLITSTDFKVAEENATKAKLVAPPGSKILLYKRKNSWWATVVIYSNNSTASADLSQYTKNNDWVGAQVVTLASWCPNATQYELMRSTADGGSLSALDCHQ
jgi:hypothetical protein